jgi:hypothetical protein
VYLPDPSLHVIHTVLQYHYYALHTYTYITSLDSLTWLAENMVLSYLVSTAGHAQHQNETYPHDIRTIVQLITEGAEEFGDEKVVGFTSPDTGITGGDAAWRCDRYCTFLFEIELIYSFQATPKNVGRDGSGVGEARSRDE